MTVEKHPRVSVGLPTANRASTLLTALQAILAQTYDDFELVISDNSSTDETPALCQEFSRRDSRIRYSRNDQNIGIVGNFNRVIALSRGEFFVLATDDDVWEPRFLELLVDVLDREPAVTLAFCNWDWIDTEGRRLRPGKIGRFTAGQRRFTQLWKLAAGGDAHLTFGVQRRSTLNRSPGFLPFNPDGHGADAIVLFSHAVHGRIATIDPVLFHYRLGANISRLRSLPSIDELILKEVRYYANLTAYVRNCTAVPRWQRMAVSAVLTMRFGRSLALYNLLWAARSSGDSRVEDEGRAVLRAARCRRAAYLFFPPGVHRILRSTAVRRLLRWMDRRIAAGTA